MAWSGAVDNANIQALRELLSASTQPQNVIDAFGTKASTNEFTAKFADSVFAEEYAASRASKRRVRSFEDGGGAAADTSFATFVTNELADRGNVDALVAAVVLAVNRDVGTDGTGMGTWIAARRNIPSSPQAGQADLNVAPTGLTLSYDVLGATAGIAGADELARRQPAELRRPGGAGRHWRRAPGELQAGRGRDDDIVAGLCRVGRRRRRCGQQARPRHQRVPARVRRPCAAVVL